MCIVTDYAIFIRDNLIPDDLKPHGFQLFNIEVDGPGQLFRIFAFDFVRDLLIVD